MVKVIWTDNAISNLDEIGNYIAKNSDRYAAITVQKLFKAVDILEQHPKAGRMVPEFETENIRELIRGNYRIIYEIVNEFRIDITSIHHGAKLL